MEERIRELIGEIVAIILSFGVYKVKRVFLFGSRARRDNVNAHADIDIGIVADRPLIHSELVGIKEKISDMNTLFKIDIVDFTNRNDNLSRVALQDIEVVYEEGKAS